MPRSFISLVFAIRQPSSETRDIIYCISILEVFSFWRDGLVEFQWRIDGRQSKDNEKLNLC